MKKLALLMAVLMLISAMLVACSKKTQDEEDDETKDPSIVQDDETDSETDTEDVTGEDETGTGEYVEPTTFTFTACDEKTIYTVGAVNIRKEASFANTVEKKSVVDHTALTKIAESNETAIDSEGNEYKWFKVKYEDSEWYVKSTLTTSLADPDEGFTAVTKTLYLNTQSLSVRQFPNTENAAVGYLYKGDTVKVIAENTESGWYKIEFEGKYTPKGEYYIVSDAKYFSETPVESDSGAQG